MTEPVRPQDHNTADWQPVLPAQRLAEGGPLRVGILLSGGGRTARNLLAHVQAGNLPIKVVGALHSRPRSPRTEAAYAGLQAAEVPVETLHPRQFPDASAFAAEQAARLAEWGAELVCMAGYLVHWPIPAAYRWRVLNIHPSLLPRFGGPGFWGERVHAAVLAAGERESGCTIHFADDEYDHGAILLQRRVPVEPGDTPATLAARVFEQECAAYPEALRLIAAGRVHVNPRANVARVLPA